MIWENGIEIWIISYMKRVASPGLMHDTGCLGLAHWDDPEGWCGEGGGRRVQDGQTHVYLWRIHFDIWQNQYNIVKFKNKIKLKKNEVKNNHQNKVVGMQNRQSRKNSFIWGVPKGERAFPRSFSGGPDGKEYTCNAGDPGSIPGFGNIPWRREWQPTPEFLPGESHGQRSLAGYSPWGHKESETTD